MADYENVLAWEARNAIFEGNLYSLLNILRGMPEEVLKREEWVYWLGRAHAVRGNHEEAKKRFATIAGNWSFYGKLACDALKRPYPKPTLREPPQEEAVERTSSFTAEEWITDEEALSKDGKKLTRISGRFRRATIDRKDEIFRGAGLATGAIRKRKVVQVIETEE